MQPRYFGTLVGILLGMTWVFGNFFEMIVVAVCGLVGFVMVKVLEGELDLSDFVGRRRV